MSIHTLKQLSVSESQNEFGETPLPFAPRVELSSGRRVVPQQYLNVTRSLATLEAVISRITFSDQYLLFAGEINDVLYLQVGVIGSENYPSRGDRDDEVKIVYGRRWLIEPTTTTSEVVQTAMLAIKKAREHELREKVVKTINQGQNNTTPFNTHMDLPQMAGNESAFSPEIKTLQQQIHELENTVLVGGCPLKVRKTHLLGDARALIQLDLMPTSNAAADFPELGEQCIDVLCDSRSSTDLLHELMSQLVRSSDRHIEETLSFDGFARFSRTMSVEQIAQFSYESRNIKHKDPRFDEHFKEMSYQVDSSKAPPIATGALGDRQRSALKKRGVTAGYVPIEAQEPDADALSAY